MGGNAITKRNLTLNSGSSRDFFAKMVKVNNLTLASRAKKAVNWGK
jgi:hypothetical protein